MVISEGILSGGKNGAGSVDVFEVCGEKGLIPPSATACRRRVLRSLFMILSREKQFWLEDEGGETMQVGCKGCTWAEEVEMISDG